MKTMQIRYLPAAQDDLLEILEYIMKDSPLAAMEFIEQIDTTVGQLGTFPRIGVVPKDPRLERLCYRMLVIQSYLVFYVIHEEAIEVRRIIHGKRKYSFLL